MTFSCSEYEARNYGWYHKSIEMRAPVIDLVLGRFLLGVLTDIAKWYQDEQLFTQENRTKSGGNTSFLPGLQLRWTPKTVISQEDLISWNDWRQVVRKWHRKLCKVRPCLTALCAPC